MSIEKLSFIFLAIAISVALGVAIGVGKWMVAAGAFAAFVVVVGNVIAVQSMRNNSSAIFYVACGLPLFYVLIQKITLIPVGYVIEVGMLLLLAVLAKEIFKVSRHSGLFRWVLIFFFLQTLLAVVSSVMGRSTYLAAIWQFYYNFKWLLMLGFGLVCTWNFNIESKYQLFIRWVWLFVLPLLILEIAAPGTYVKLMDTHEVREINPLVGGLTMKLRGPFGHSGYLAMFCVLMLGSCVVYARRDGWKNYLLPFLAYCLLLLLAGERQEFLAGIVGVLFVILLAHKKAIPWVLASGSLIIVLAILVFVMVGHVPMQEVMSQWGITGSGRDLSERAVLTFSGFDIANKYFPLGAGLGTYGGPGAQKFDQTLFVDMGFNKYWWFRKGLFLVDTYWPNIIAESGWFGAFLLFLCYSGLTLQLIILVYRGAGNSNIAVFEIALIGLVALLLNSPTSGVITDPRGCILFWVFVGLALRLGVPSVKNSGLCLEVGK